MNLADALITNIKKWMSLYEVTDVEFGDRIRLFVPSED